jgi:hypothetical protein
MANTFVKGLVDGELKDAEGNITQSGTVIHRDGANDIKRVDLRFTLEDSVGNKKQFQTILEGDTLAPIGNDLTSTAFTNYFKKKSDEFFTDWQKDLDKASEPTPTVVEDKDITGTFSTAKEITSLK